MPQNTGSRIRVCQYLCVHNMSHVSFVRVFLSGAARPCLARKKAAATKISLFAYSWQLLCSLCGLISMNLSGRFHQCAELVDFLAGLFAGLPEEFAGKAIYNGQYRAQPAEHELVTFLQNRLVNLKITCDFTCGFSSEQIGYGIILQFPQD